MVYMIYSRNGTNIYNKCIHVMKYIDESSQGNISSSLSRDPFD